LYPAACYDVSELIGSASEISESVSFVTRTWMARELDPTTVEFDVGFQDEALVQLMPKFTRTMINPNEMP
jgi:hypothetical protein